jgi:ribosome maturation factor RimP
MRVSGSAIKKPPHHQLAIKNREKGMAETNRKNTQQLPDAVNTASSLSSKDGHSATGVLSHALGLTSSPNAHGTTSHPTTIPVGEELEKFLTPIIEAIGYEIVLLEAQSHKPKTIRLFIDFLKGNATIGINDCANVSRAVDEPLELFSAPDSVASPGVRSWLTSGFELEVSSPGIDRPLRKAKDFLKFIGREVRLTTLRALSDSELQNTSYFLRNPKQKNYIGEIEGFENGDLLLKVYASMGSIQKTAPKLSKTAKKKTDKKVPEPSLKADSVRIPLSLVSKANLEPHYDGLNEENGEEIHELFDEGFDNENESALTQSEDSSADDANPPLKEKP